MPRRQARRGDRVEQFGQPQRVLEVEILPADPPEKTITKAADPGPLEPPGDMPDVTPERDPGSSSPGAPRRGLTFWTGTAMKLPMSLRTIISGLCVGGVSIDVVPIWESVPTTQALCGAGQPLALLGECVHHPL